MSRSRRVIVAYAVSVLFHLILFTVLALAPERQLVPVTPGDKDDAPLEITVQMAKAESATPTPTPAPAASPTPEPEKIVQKTEPENAVSVLPLVGSGIKTQLDPANLKKSDKAPEKPVFIASHNSVATKPKANPAKNAASTPAEPKPQQRPAETDLAAMEYGIIRKAAAAAPKVLSSVDSLPRPTPIPRVSAATPQFRTTLPSPTPIAVARNVAQQESASGASPSPSATPPAGKPQGANGDEDEVGVDAIGKWNKSVANAVGSVWTFFSLQKSDLLVDGDVRVKFLIDAGGHVSEIRIVSNTANPTNAMYAVRSVREAEIPPIPPERLARVPSGHVEITYTFNKFTILPNQ